MKIQGANEEMLMTACQQFMGKSEREIQEVARETLEGHQRAIMGNMTVEVQLLLVLLEFCVTEKPVFDFTPSPLNSHGSTVWNDEIRGLRSFHVRALFRLIPRNP